MATRMIPGPEQVMDWMQSLSNWGRWGPDDELGTLNYITPEKRVAAGNLVRKGISVTTSRMIIPESTIDNPMPPLHFMTGSGDAAPAQGNAGSGDFIGLNVHGYNVTHIDALCHFFWNGKSYNGLDAKLVTTARRATKGGVEVIENGVVTRGVLLDIAKVRGVDWMKPGEGILPEDLEAAEAAAGLKVEPGDALLYRTGWPKAREAEGPPVLPGRPGMHAASLPWLHERGVALIAADAATDVEPTGYDESLPFRLPVHAIGISAMGLWILDGANYERLAEVCNRENRWEFLFVMAPLRWLHATGSPVNPIAIL